MRLSCNGCRVLRKGCSEACSIRPCLQWIKSPDAQANATVFLAKFYGRAGLMNLINAGPENLRPAIFRSLLYEACGRIVNPIYGSVGLLWSGNWQMCQAAVEAVLKGAPIVQISSEAAAASPTPAHLHKAYDIRHVSKTPPPPAASDADAPHSPPSKAAVEEDSQSQGLLHKVAKARRTRFKRTSASSTSARKNHKADKPKQPPRPENDVDLDHQDEDVFQRAPSHASSDSHVEELRGEREPSLDTDAEAGSHVSQAEQSTGPAGHNQQDAEVEEEQQQQLGLELTLGFAPVSAISIPSLDRRPAVHLAALLVHLRLDPRWIDVARPSPTSFRASRLRPVPSAAVRPSSSVRQVPGSSAAPPPYVVGCPRAHSTQAASWVPPPRLRPSRRPSPSSFRATSTRSRCPPIICRSAGLQRLRSRHSRQSSAPMILCTAMLPSLHIQSMHRCCYLRCPALPPKERTVPAITPALPPPPGATAAFLLNTAIKEAASMAYS